MIGVRQPVEGHGETNSTWPSAGSSVVQLMEAVDEVILTTVTAEMPGGVVSGRGGGGGDDDGQVNVARLDGLKPKEFAAWTHHT